MVQLNLRKKLIFVFMGIGLIPLSVVSFYSYFRSSKSLEEAAYTKLDAVRAAKGNEVTRYFETIRDQMLTFSESTMTIEAMREFKASFRTFREDNRISQDQVKTMADELSTYYTNDFTHEYKKQNGVEPNALAFFNQLDEDSLALQYYYIQANRNPLGSKHLLQRANDSSRYSQLHAKYHPIIKSFLEKFGYYDIFLVDPETGDIVYTVFKELDFSTSLIDGPYAQTTFGEVFRQVNDSTSKDVTILVDYKRYSPSYEAPASFIGSPIYDGKDKIGVALFQMPINRLNQIMAERSGMGETGETYLVGPEFLMRSDSFHKPDSHSVVNSFRNEKDGKVKTAASVAALEGQSGHTIDKNYAGDYVLSSYSPLEVLGLKWALIAEVHSEEAFGPIYSLRFWLLIVGILSSIAIVAIGFFMSRTIADPILKIASDLTRGLLKVEGISKQISSSSQELSDTTTKQSSAIEETVSSMEEMESMLKQTSHNADETMRLSEEGQRNARHGQDVISNMVVAMDDIQQSNSKLERIVKVIAEIREKTRIINDIVSETRLLSFNASIEAARAGVHGKGFAVVAEEVGNLAAMSGKAAEEIRTLLETSTGEVSSVVTSTQERVNVAKKISQDCERAFRETSEGLNKIVSSIQSINSATKEQETGIQQTNQAMSEMESITQQNSANSQVLAKQAADLEVGSINLKDSIIELKTIVLGGGDNTSIKRKKKNNNKLSKSDENLLSTVEHSSSNHSLAGKENSEEEEISETDEELTIERSDERWKEAS